MLLVPLSQPFFCPPHPHFPNKHFSPPHLNVPTLSLTIHGKSCGSAMYPLKILSEAGSAAEAAIPVVVLQRKDGREKARYSKSDMSCHHIMSET